MGVEGSVRINLSGQELKNRLEGKDGILSVFNNTGKWIKDENTESSVFLIKKTEDGW